MTWASILSFLWKYKKQIIIFIVILSIFIFIFIQVAKYKKLESNLEKANKKIEELEYTNSSLKASIKGKDDIIDALKQQMEIANEAMNAYSKLEKEYEKEKVVIKEVVKEVTKETNEDCKEDKGIKFLQNKINEYLLEIK